ncbi:Unknown protein, partial [Striga hermonthica]
GGNVAVVMDMALQWPLRESSLTRFLSKLVHLSKKCTLFLNCHLRFRLIRSVRNEDGLPQHGHARDPFLHINNRAGGRHKGSPEKD